MAGEWDVVEQVPVGGKRPSMPPPAAAGEWDVVEQAPAAGARTQVGFGDAFLRAAKGMISSSGQKAGVLMTALPAMGAQAVKNLITGNPDSDILDYQRSTFVDPWERRAQDAAIKPTEELTGPGIAGNVGGSIAGMVPDMLMGGPGKKVVETGNTVLQNALAKFASQAPSGANLAATQGFNTSNQLQASGVPKEVADRAAIASYPANFAGFTLPLTIAAKVLPRAGMGALTNVATDIPATMQENQVLRDFGHAEHVQDLLDPTRLSTSAGLGAALSAIMGQRAPAPRVTRETGGYVPGTAGYKAEPERVPDWAMQRYGDVLAANGITDPADPRALNAVARLQQSEGRKAEMRPGQGDPHVDAMADAIFGGEAHPNAAPWAGRVAEGPPSTVQVDSAGNAIPLDSTGAPQRPGDVAGRDNQQAARDLQIREAYAQAGLNPDSQANAMGRANLPPDEAPDIRSLKAELDPEQVDLIGQYMGVFQDDLAKMGPNAQRKMLARAMEAHEQDQLRYKDPVLQTTFEGGEAPTSPASRPNVPGERMSARSEFEDTSARLAQDQGAADLNDLRRRAASGDQKAVAALHKREQTAKKAAAQKTALIERLQGLRQQREALSNSKEYQDLQRTRDTGGELSEQQRKKLKSYDLQHETLGKTIFDLEGGIYDLSAKSDLESTAASGSGDRPFRGFSKEEGEHAGMFEARAREKASEAEKAAIDKLEAEWRARERMRSERAPRQPEQPQPKQTEPGTANAAPAKDGAFDTNEDGFVASTNGNPIHFGHQRDAGWWILKTGNKQSARQVFEIANHPSGKGFSVRETHKTEPGAGGKQEGTKQEGAKQESGGQGGPMAVRGNEPRPEGKTSQEGEASKPGEKQEVPPEVPPVKEPEAPAPKGKKAKVRKKRERVRPIRDLLAVLRSEGGIDPFYRSGVVGEKKGSFGNLFIKGGKDLNAIADLMYDQHFLDYTHMNDPETHPSDHASELIRRALAGETVLSADDQIAAHERQQAADYRDNLLDQVKDKGVKLKKNERFLRTEEIEAALAEHEAKAQAERDALADELDKAYNEGERVLGDRVSSILTSAEGKTIETWYRENIAAIERAIEEENAYNEHVRTSETKPGRQEESHQPGGEGGAEQAPARDSGPEESRGSEGGEGAERPDFDLRKQSEAELKAKADAEAEAKAKEESAQRKADAEAREAREKKEIESRQKSSAENFKLGESAEDSLSGQKDLLSGDGKSDAGTLFANPFHKALGWAFGDSKAWAKSLGEFGQSIRDIAKAGANNVKESPLVSFVRAVFDSSSADIRSVIRKAGESKTAQWVVDQFHDEAGSGRATGETYGEAVNAKTNQRMVELHRLIGDISHDEGAMRQLANMVRAGTARAGTKLGDAAIAIRKMLDDELKYLRDAGVDLGEVKNGYFPREYVAEKIAKNGQKFIDAATKAYVESGMSRADAALAAKELHDGLVYGEHGSIFKSQGGSGQAPFLKGRTFGKAVDNPSHPLNEFLNHDTAEVLTQYFQRAAKRAEIARRFGDNFSHWRDHKDASGKPQDGILTRIEKEGGQAALTKLQDYISLAAGIRAHGIGAGGIRTASIMRTWGALSFLEKATLSSLAEFVAPAMRSGNVTDAGRGLVNVLNDLFIKTKDAKARRAFAEDLGLISGHIDSALSAARFAGGQPVGKVESKVLQSFFRRTGLSQWTDATRVASTDTGRVFIRRLAKDDDGKLNTRYLADLGIPADKIAEFKKFVNAKADGMPGMGDLKGEMGDLYRVAVRKFVSQSIMNPGATTKPSWMSHPIGAVVGQLQSFNYAFYENVVKRTARQVRESATGEGYTNMERAKLVAPLLISPLLAAVQYAVGEGRDALLGDPNRREKETTGDKVLKAVSRGIPIAPLDPLVNYVTSAKYQRGAAQTFAGPVGGVAATGLDAARDAFLNNSEKTNTQERAAAKAFWDIFVEPAVNLALYSSPVSPVSAALTQAAGSGHVREKFFVTPVAGAKKQVGDREGGRTERLSPR